MRAKTPTPVAFVLSAYVRERGTALREPGAVAMLVESREPLEGERRVEAAPAFAADPELMWIPLVDERRRPAGLLERGAFERGERAETEALTIAPSSALVEVARRAMLRPAARRFYPLVCCDARGRYLGLVRIERLVERLADTAR